MKELRMKEKQTNFIEVFKSFWQPDEKEVPEETLLQTSSQLSDADRKELLKSLKDTDSLAKETFKFPKIAKKTRKKAITPTISQDEMPKTTDQVQKTIQEDLERDSRE